MQNNRYFFISLASLLLSLLAFPQQALCEKLSFDIYSPVECDDAFLGRSQVGAVSSTTTCKVRVTLTKNGVPQTDRRVRLSVRTTGGGAFLKRKNTDSKGQVVFSFQVDPSYCYFTVTDGKTGTTKNIVLLLNNTGSCGV